MTPLFGKTLEEITAVVASLGMPKFTAKQITDWLYKKRVSSIDDMSNISLANREKLSEKFSVYTKDYKPTQFVESKDGTKKYLFKAAEGYVETVYLPEEERATLCVSSQVGCKMSCLFCMTGKQGFSGQLSTAEILQQIVCIDEFEMLTNLVFMGMGEPFDNTDEVIKALNILTAEWGFAMSPRRITVSTIGIHAGMRRFLEETQCHLAISLHTPIHEERKSLMPMEKKYPIEQTIDIVRDYDFAHQRRLSFEYILFDGINDTQRHLTGLVRMLKPIPGCRVNIIKWHNIDGADELELKLKPSPYEKMVGFRDYLTNNGIITTIRRSRGEDIMAACGQLSSEKQK